jgi:hypothetical protein
VLILVYAAVCYGDIGRSSVEREPVQPAAGAITCCLCVNVTDGSTVLCSPALTTCAVVLPYKVLLSRERAQNNGKTAYVVIVSEVQVVLECKRCSSLYT